MKNKLNYYLILNISDKSDQKKIRETYLKLTKNYHPDKHKGNKLAEQRFKQINLAYQVLQDPEKKKSFDKELYIFQQRLLEKKISDLQKSEKIKNLKKEKSTKNESSFISRFLQKGREEKPLNTEVNLMISLEDLCQTSLKKISYSKPYNGTQKEASIEVLIPKGAKTGTCLQFKNKGGSYGKKICGNLLVKLQIKDHHLFTVKNHDVFLTLPIKFTNAFNGIKIEGPSLYGKVLFTIHPQTKHNHILQFKNLGLPKSPELKGSMFVTIFIDYPSGKRIEIQKEMENLSDQKKRSYIKQYITKNDRFEKVLNFEKALKSVKQS